MKNKKMLAAIVFVGLSISHVRADPIEDSGSVEDDGAKAIIKGFDLLKRKLNLYLYSVDSVVNWTMLNIAIKDLDATEFAQIYSEKTVDLMIEFKSELRKAKDLYEDMTSLVYSWATFAKRPLEWLKNHLPNEPEAEVSDKLVKILSQLMTKGTDKFRSAEVQFLEVQKHLSSAKQKFEQFQASASEDYRILEGYWEKIGASVMSMKLMKKNESCADTLLVVICIKDKSSGRLECESTSADDFKKLDEKYKILEERMNIAKDLFEKAKVEVVEREYLINGARSNLTIEVELSEIVGDSREQIIDKIQSLEESCSEYRRRHSKAAGMLEVTVENK